MTPYEILGVTSDADQDAIHSAYRAKAKTQHPDAGGDHAAFELLKSAHDLLMDEDRREHYDKTGEVLPKTADNDLSRLLSLISGAFDEAMVSIIEAEEEAAKVDVLQRMRSAFVGRIEKLMFQKREAENSAAIVEPTLGRFSRGDGGQNYLEMVVREKIRHFGEIAKGISVAIDEIKEALKVLDGYNYRSDPLPSMLAYTEPRPWSPKVTVDLGIKRPSEPRSFQEELAERLYGRTR
jgi:curved DNA-binding protein CbpA